MKAEKLLKLADFLDKLDDDKFWFGTVVNMWERKEKNTCGTVCCAMGWTPQVFPDEVGWRAPKNLGNQYDDALYLKNTSDDITNYDTIARKIFGISYDEVDFLFSPGDQEDFLEKHGIETDIEDFTSSTSREQVANNIRYFVENKIEGIF